MEKFLRSAAIILAIACFYSRSYAQGSTSFGTEFWTAFMANTNPPGSAAGSVMVLYVTSDVNTSVLVSIGGQQPLSYAVNANQITTVTIDPSAYLANPGLSNTSIHITALKPVAVYAHIFALASSGAALLLPVNALGKDYESINYTQVSNIDPSYSAFLVIATEDNTMVELTERTTTIFGALSQKIDTITLNKGQVYQVLAKDDLTGSRIRSISSGANPCKKIAVFSGSTRLYIGCDNKLTSSDNLFQQAFPTASWGENYITVPLKSRNYDIFRVVFSDPNTNLTVGGQTISPSLYKNGLYYEFKAQQPMIIQADRPSQVVQYSVTQGNTIDCKDDTTDVGDPEMIYLSPLEQTLNHITLFSASNYEITADYINVVIPTTAVASFLLDGVHPGAFNIVPPDDEAYCYAQIHVKPGPHVLSANGGFNAIAYGFGEHESFGYSAGASLQDLSSFVSLVNPQTGIAGKSGCANVGYNLQLTLPYKTDTIKWNLSNGTSLTQANPVVVGTSANGDQTLYQYNYPQNPVSFTAGSYSATATVFNPVADACGSVQQVELDFGISNPPVAAFKVDVANANYGTSFIDESTSTSDIVSWQWDFGDGQTSTDENPVHSYAQPGKYKVTLAVSDVDGCASSTDQFVTINITASAASGSIGACKGQAAAAPTIQQFTVAGGYLQAGLSIAAPANFEISFDPNTGYASNLTINETGGTANSTTVYVRSVAGAPLGNIGGDVTITSAGVPGVKVAVAGIVNDLPSMNPVSNQTFYGGVPSTPIIFTGNSNTFTWTNDNPGIGLAASGQNNINSFKPVNTGKNPVTANITVTPSSLTVAYIANANEGTVSVINTVTNAIVANIAVGSYPQGVAATADGSRVYVTNERSGTISVIDAHSNTLLVPDIKTPADPYGICVSPDGKWVYATSVTKNEVIIMSSSTFVPNVLPVQSEPTGIAISPDGSTLYVSNSGSGTVSVINTTANNVTNTISVGATPNGLVVSPDGSKLYVDNGDSGTVSIINTTTFALIATVAVGSQPFGITVNADGSTVYVTNSQSNTVSVIDANTYKVIATIPVGTVPFGVCVSPEGNNVYVANQTSNNISVINTKTNLEQYRFKSDPGPTSFGNFIINGTGCTGLPVHFTITVEPGPGTPEISYTGAPDSMTTMYGHPSPSANFTITADYLTAPVSVAAPGGFEVSTDNNTFSSSISVSPASGGSVTYVRLGTGIKVGTYSDSVKLSSTGATTMAIPVNGTVTPAPLSIAADNKTKLYGVALPALTATYTGLENNDKPASLTVKPQITTTATANSPIGQYPITVDGAESANYDISYIPGIMEIVAVPPQVSIPNTFTPNGDGINDNWDIKNIEGYPNVSVNIFNRFGQSVYSSIGYAIPWDGNYHGAALPSGTYYYIIDLKQGAKPLSGFVAIIR